jgi:hypothetical protein
MLIILLSLVAEVAVELVAEVKAEAELAVYVAQ